MIKYWLRKTLCRLFGHKPDKYYRQLAAPPAAWLFKEGTLKDPPKGFMHPSWTGYLPDHDRAVCQRCHTGLFKYDNAEDEALAKKPFLERREYFHKWYDENKRGKING